MASGTGSDYSSSFGFALSEEECAIADLFHQHVTQTAIVKFYVHPGIPAQKLANAKSSYAPTQDREAVLCLIDPSVFGAARDGLVVTVRVLYWKVFGVGKNEQRSFAELGRVTVDTSFLSRGLRLEDGTAITVAGIDIGALTSLADFLNRTKDVSVKSWYLGIGGTQQGPFDVRTIQKKMTNGEIDPQNCLAWKKGMAAWLPYLQVPELAGEIQQPPPLPSDAPPPMPAAAPPALTAPPSLNPAAPLSPKPLGSSQQREELLRLKKKLEDLQKRAGEAGDQPALQKLEKLLQDRSAEKAEAFWDESATNPAMAEQCADCLSLLSGALNEIENALVQAEENKSFLAGIEDVYRKEDRKPN